MSRPGKLAEMSGTLPLPGEGIVSDHPETQFTRVDGLDIAYQVVGPPAERDVMFIPSWISHLEVM